MLMIHHNREEFTARIAQRGYPWLQGIQFDMLPWHNNSHMLNFLEATKQRHGLAIFLQCHKAAMEELGPKGVVRRIGHYAAFVDYLLFDASHGTGHRMNVDSLNPFIEESYSATPLNSTGIAIAGGLDAVVVKEDLPKLIGKYPELSWDAEGRLHPINNNGKRPLNMQVVQAYLQASSDVLQAK